MNLPEDCFHEIIQYLPYLERASFRQINKQWRDYIDSSFVRMSPKQASEFIRICQKHRMDPSELIPKIQQKLTNCQELQLDDSIFSEASNLIIFQALSKNDKLQSLKLACSKVHVLGPKAFGPFLKQNLRDLDITIKGSDISALARSLGCTYELKHFALTVDSDNGDKSNIKYELRHILEKLPRNMLSLRIDCYDVFEAIDLFTHIVEFRSLESLWIDSRYTECPKSAGNWNKVNMEKVINECWKTSLKKLHLSWLPTNWCWSALFQLRNLEEFYLCGAEIQNPCPTLMPYSQILKKNNPKISNYFFANDPPCLNDKHFSIPTQDYFEFLKSHKVRGRVEDDSEECICDSD